MIPIRVLISNPDRSGTMLVPLSRGRFAIIDETDAEAVGAHNWHLIVPHADRTPYAMSSIGSLRGANGKRIRLREYLHRFLWSLWGLPPAPELDHRNGDGLDCRRDNVRAATVSQNQQNRKRPRTNTSGFKGVHWDARDKRWCAHIELGEHRRSLGRFSSKEEAARAYAAAATALFGEFSRPE